MASEPYVAYVTVPEMMEAARIARQVVGARLAACANIMPNVQSVYHWDDEICIDNEVTIIFKTSSACIDDLAAMVYAEHSYDTPCVTAWPLTGGHPDYINWMLRETAGGGQTPQAA